MRSMKVAVVTGGTRGIGAAIARRLVADGYAVIAAARTEASTPTGVDYARLDVTSPSEVRDFFAGLDRLDLLVNNAGLAGADPDEDDEAFWDAIIATNLTASWRCARAALKRLPDRTGRIVNISSILGLQGVPDQLAYCAAKHGVVGLTRALALETAKSQVTVNAVCPGWVDTAMAHQRFAELGITAAQAAAAVPTGHIATTYEIAEMVAFLARAGARSLTGQALVIDGGSSTHA